MRKPILLILFLFTVLQAQSQIQSINPDTAMRGQVLNTTVTMVNGTIGTGSGPWQSSDIFLQQGASIINCTWPNWNWGSDNGTPSWNIPTNAALGLYDLHVTTYDFNNNPIYWTATNFFFIRPFAGSIEGDLYFDINQNGIRDGGEPDLDGAVSMNGGYVYTNWYSGHYKAYLDTNTYTIDYVPWGTFAQTSLPANYTVPVPPSHTGLDFGAYSAQAAYSHYLSTWRHPFRCAPFMGYTYIDCRHYGPLPVNGKVTMVISSTLTVDSINPAPDLIVGDTMIWYYDSLSYGERFHVGGGGGQGTCISFFDPPAGILGWYVVTDSIFDYTTGAFVKAYVDSFGCVASCSYDPNDKNVSPVGDGPQHNTPPNTLLTYTINFQNTGNDTAFNVIVVDTLDPDLDWSTFRVISSIHSVNTQMDANGVVKFTFENIQLPDSNVDEPGSHGTVVYQIMTDSLLPDPTEITNTAYIYFDYNAPVITNTTLSTITVSGLPVASFSANDVTVCPGYCINFTSTPNPGSSYQWTFPGANPSSSTDENPSNICYIAGGTYDVNLVVTNSFGSDSATYPNYVNVYTVASQAITQSGDTLFANSGFVTYVWYYNGNIISGATSYFYVAMQNGDYHVISWDANGCDVEAAAFNIMTSVNHSIEEASISIYPNPAGDWFEISGLNVDAVSVYNVLGEIVLYNDITAGGKSHVIDITALPPGSYSVEVISNGKPYRSSIVKQ